jgi:hypothetical protein
VSTIRKTRGIHQTGTRAAQPLATAVLEGTLYWVTDEYVLERSNGSAWVSISQIGEVTNIAFDAGDFTGNTGAGSWVVASGDVQTFSYVRLGNVVLVSIALNTTTTASSPTQLLVEIPFTAAVSTEIIGRQYNATVGHSIAHFVIAAASNQIAIRFIDGAAWPNLTNDIYVFGIIPVFI